MIRPMKVSVPLTILGLLLVTGCEGSAPDQKLELLSDWSSVDAVVVSDVSGQTVLSGIDTRNGRIDPLTVLPRSEDTRMNRSAQVIRETTESYLVVLPGDVPQHGIAYEVDLRARSVTKKATLPDALHLARLGTTYLGVGQDPTGKFVLDRYGPGFKPSAGLSFPAKPSYSGADHDGSTLCYAGGDGNHQNVMVYRPQSSSLALREFSTEGNLTGVACAGGHVVVAIGDKPMSTASTGADPVDVKVESKAGDPSVEVVTSGRGSSGKVALQAEKVLVDVPSADGRDLVSLAPGTRAVAARTPLQGVGTVECIVPLGNSVLVVGTDRLFIISQEGRPTALTVQGDLYDMSIDTAGDAVPADTQSN